MYDPQMSAPGAPPPSPPARSGVLIWVVVGLGGLVLLMAMALVLLVLLLPNVRAQIPFLGPGIAAPPEAPRQLERPSGKLLIEENFDQPTERWDQSQSQVVNGVYELRVDTPNHDGYGLYLGPPAPADSADAPVLDASQIANFDIAVDVKQVAGDPTSEYGIRFRQSTPDDYLMFSISGSGYYRLLRVRDDQYTSLKPWTYSSQIKRGPDAINRLRVRAEGTTITGWINGVQVVEYSDTLNNAGQLTLGLATFDQGGLTVQFSNIEGSVEMVEFGSNAAPQTIDLKENFSNPDTVPWSVGGAAIVDGAYEMSVGRGVQTWQQPLPEGSSQVKDFVVEVDAAVISGAESNVAYGLIFGDGGEFDFYSLYLFPEGGVGLFRTEPNADPIVLIPASRFDAVKPGANAVNRIRIEVNQGNLKIDINDESLIDTEIPSSITIEGRVGMIIAGGTGSGVRVRFDNFRLEELNT